MSSIMGRDYDHHMESIRALGDKLDKLYRKNKILEDGLKAIMQGDTYQSPAGNRVKTGGFCDLAWETIQKAEAVR